MATRANTVFNIRDRAVEGWYWAMPSSDVRRGQVRKLELLGRQLVLWRGDDGVVHCFDAYCPHMGAHLGEGRVDGGRLRCFFHDWAFEPDGRVVDVPCAEHTPRASVNVWPVEEVYGLVWVYTGREPRHPVPFVPELEGRPLRWRHGNHFVKGCHPNVVMINAIDEQHFASVHNLPVDLRFEIEELSTHASTYDNATHVPRDSWFTKAIGRFYEGPLTYRMTYWSGTNGSVTVGPDFWHFHIMFALRPTAEGHTEGQTLLLTPRVDGIRGRVWNRIALHLTELVGNYFAKGDTEVFQSIRWDFRTPLKADRSIVHFIKHVERQPTVRWESWEPVPTVVAAQSTHGSARGA